MESLIAHLIGQDALLTYHGKTVLVVPEVIALTALLWSVLMRREALRETYAKLPKNILYACGLLLVGGAISVLVSGHPVSATAAYKAWLVFPLVSVFLLASSQRGGLYARLALYAATVAQLAFSLLSSHGHSLDNRLIGTLSSPNYLSMLLGPVFVLLLLDAWRSKWRAAWLLAALIVLGGLLATKSIGGLVGISGAIIYLLFRIEAPKAFRIGLGSLLVLVALIGGTLLSDRLQSGQANSVSSRLEIWQTASVLGSEQPLTGIGLGNFPQRYSDRVFSVIHKNPIEWTVPLPHNLLLAFWLYTGVLGLAGLLFLLWEITKASHGLIYLPIIALCLHGLVDTPYFYTPIVYVFWLLVAIGLADSWQNRQITFLSSSKRSTR